MSIKPNGVFIRRLVHERRIPYLEVGHFVRFDPADVEQVLRASRVEEHRRWREPEVAPSPTGTYL